MKRIRIKGLSLFIFSMLVTQIPAEIPSTARLVQSIEWREIKLPQEVSLVENGTAILIKSDKAEPVNVPLAKLENVKIQSKWYALRGLIRYTNVSQASYLETWNEFLPSQPGAKNVRAFSRTLAEAGSMAKILDSSDWRPVFIPFDGSAATGPPLKIDLNLVLNGKGEVTISNLEVLEFSHADSLWSAMSSAPEATRLSGLKVGTFAFLGALLLGIVIFFFANEKTRKAEARRMKAMDV